MKVLYSTQAIVQFDGKNYFSNAVQSTYPRYTVLGDEIICLAHIKKVAIGTEDMIDKDAIKFVHVDKINSLGSLLFGIHKNNKTVSGLVKMVDVCVAHIPAFHSESVIRYAKKFGIPYMTVVVGCSWDSYWNYNFKGKILAPFCYFSLKKAQSNAPYSIYVTNSFLQKRYPTTGKWIGCSNVNLSTGVNGVLEHRIEQLIYREKTNAVMKIGTAAAIDVPYKGQAYVIEAIGILKKEGFSFEYHLVGGGISKMLKKLAIQYNVEDCVFFHGRVAHDKIVEFLDDLDIYIQPSKQEGLPRATIEAMSRGCLCLGSNIAGIPELLDSRFLFPKGDAKSISNILRHISFDECKRQACRNYEVAKEYDKDVLNAKRAKFINEFKEGCLNNR